jgi:hypothetical protein
VGSTAEICKMTRCLNAFLLTKFGYNSGKIAV